ncbi:MAG: phage antirepressor KilAC domain-containing protein [Romboutsia sp.]
MQELQIFRNNEFGELNIVVKDNKQYIDAIQVGTILGYLNPRDAILRHCEKDGVVFHDTGVVTGKKIDGTDIIQYISRKYISEGNVYRLIVRSKLPSAKRFEKWLMEEVLPSIRKYGTYMSDEIINKTLEDPDFIIQMATKLKQEKEEKLIAQKREKDLETIINIDKPYTEFAKSIEASNEAITIGQFAKILNNNNIDIGRNRLFCWLRNNGYLIKIGKDKNIPKQAYINSGLFKVSEELVHTIEGDIISTTTLITGKGQMYFINKLNITN